MQFRLGGDIGRIIEEEAEKRGISGATLAKTIIGDWVRDSYKKRMKKGKKTTTQPQEQAVVTTGEVPSDEAIVPDGEGNVGGGV